MKTLHYQQDSHHKSDIRSKNALGSNKSENSPEYQKSNMSSLFAPFYHFGMDKHPLIPFFKMEKHVPEGGEQTEHTTNEITNSIMEAYNKQIGLSLDATQRLHKEFTDQMTTLYNINQEFWNSFLFSGK